MDPKERRERVERERRERNARLAGKVRAGQEIEPLVPVEATYFPPRQVIRKDAAALRAVFGPDDAKDGAAGGGDKGPKEPGADAP